MGKILNGILGKVSGKVSGVVGASWKDVAYLRAYVKPANPNTAAQQTQRTAFSDVVDFAKPLVGQVFNAYTDKFQKSMSGFNFFIKRNIAVWDGSPDWAAIKMTEGPLSSVGITIAEYDTATITVTFTPSYGNNGLATDKVFGVVYDTSTGIFYFAAAEVDRSTGTIDIVCETGLSTANLKNYLITAQYVGTTLERISNAIYTGTSA